MDSPTGSTQTDRLRHVRVKELFFEALDRVGPARSEFLDRACAGDGALRRDVDLLLAADETESPVPDPSTAREPFAAPRLAPGAVVDGRYRVEGLIAEGGLGSVYRATQLKLDRLVALKVIRRTDARDPAAVRRFEREALAVARLRHPHVVTTIDFGVAPDAGAYLVMEYVAGRTLREEIRSHKRFPASVAVDLVRQIASGVQAAHDAGVVHRDLKPENIAVEWTPEGPFAKVLDFGVAKLADAFDGSRTRLTVSGALVGTPRYVSPEQCRGEAVDARSDVYALGCVLYELLVGRPPFVGDSVASVLSQHVNAAPRPPREVEADVPEAVEAAVLAALAKEPGERPQSADALRRALSDALAHPTAPPDAPAPTSRDSGVVFVVDDNPANLTVLANILRDRGFRVKVASRGARAVAAIRAELPDLVMLDIQMPDIDGYEVCRMLKTGEATRDVPVIFISALDDVTVKVRAFQAGGIDYVTKPFQAEEVLARVESQLQIARLRKDLEARTRDLERRNAELLAANDALVMANRRADRVFSALSERLPGTLLDGRYRVEARIGTGGFGVVYRATHDGLKRPVAIKVFRPTSGNDSGEGLSRFEREGVSACRVNHPNAISILDSGISPAGSPYIVMELLEGSSLADEIAERGPVSVERAAAICAPVCDALAAAHDAGIVHRDVKPENVFLHRTRDGETVKVLDFGLAKVLDEERPFGRLTPAPSRSLVGTPAYIAPERLLGRVYDGRADVYSVGVVLYQLLSGELPFRSGGDMHALIAMSVTSEPAPLGEVRPGIDPTVAAVAMRALSREPDARPTARELAAELRSAVRA